MSNEPQSTTKDDLKNDTEQEADRLAAKKKEQIIADFRKMHKYGVRLSEIKARAADEESTTTSSSEQ